MDIKKENLEDFKTAISSTVRTLSNSQKIEVSFGNKAVVTEKNLINLPRIDPVSKDLNYEEIRAIADSKSLRFRFSNNETLKKYEPTGNISRKMNQLIIPAITTIDVAIIVAAFSPMERCKSPAINAPKRGPKIKNSIKFNLS